MNTTAAIATSVSDSAISTESRPQKRGLRYLTATVRIVPGLCLFVFGLNGFLNFIPQPTTPLPEGAVAFAMALVKTGYMMQIIAATQLIAGLLLLINRFVPLALALLAPFIVNSIAFHLFLEPSGLPTASVLLAAEVYLAWAYRAAYRPMLAARVSV
ncbi:MAG TPA: DoxX family protein [Opitutaceae bacterium]|nr:DoxX family protein [Opitutaceae bacterium]